MHYIIVHADTSEICADFVNEEINNGYEPYGNLAVTRWELPENEYAKEGYEYTQAMIKRDK